MLGRTIEGANRDGRVMELYVWGRMVLVIRGAAAARRALIAAVRNMLIVVEVFGISREEYGSPRHNCGCTSR